VLPPATTDIAAFPVALLTVTLAPELFPVAEVYPENVVDPPV
jgi:hypothetical protein